MYLRRGIDIAPLCAALNPGDALFCIDGDAAQAAQIKHQRALANSMARNIVPARLDRYGKPFLAGPFHAFANIGDGRAVQDSRRPAVDHGIPDNPCLIVARIACTQQPVIDGTIGDIFS